MESANPMREIFVEKLIINCCVGTSRDDKLTRAAKVLKQLSDQEPCFSRSRLTIRGFGIRRNEQISTHVTIRGDRAHDLIHRGLRVHEYTLPHGCFSDSGCFGFGIDEHIDLGLKYDPSTGIYGMDFYVVLARAGKRVSKRKHARAYVGKNQKVTKEEAMEWFKTKLEGTVN